MALAASQKRNATRGNLDLADELIAPEFVGDYIPDPPTLGPEGFKQLVSITLSAFPDMHWTIEDQLAEGSKVVTRWKFRGTHTGDYMGIPPTGKVITVTGMSLDCVLDGKLVQVRVLPALYDLQDMVQCAKGDVARYPGPAQDRGRMSGRVT